MEGGPRSSSLLEEVEVEEVVDEDEEECLFLWEEEEGSMLSPFPHKFSRQLL